ncbi:MAG: type II secretion system F family protein [Acidimicrobiales bacterium]
MSLALAVGALVGVGCIGMVRGLTPARPTLGSIAATLDRRPAAGVPADGGTGLSARSAARALLRLVSRSALTKGRWSSLAPSLAITGDSPELVASKMLVMGGAGLLTPPFLWLVGQVAGVTAVPIGIPIAVTLVTLPVGFVLPVVGLIRRAEERRHHVRVVVGSFVDLVVLNLAGGMGIESALFTAAQVSSDWAAQRISRSLMMARESGQSSWVVLSQLGGEIGVPELVELSATLQLAGTEGSRIRQSLSARAVALRRHEQADAESAANTTTERLFLPGALLLVGFLLFVGYPAFSRILGGF